MERAQRPSRLFERHHRYLAGLHRIAVHVDRNDAAAANREGGDDARLAGRPLDHHTPEEAAPILEAGLGPVMAAPVFGSMIAAWYGVDRRSTADDYLAAARRHPAFELRNVG